MSVIKEETVRRPAGVQGRLVKEMPPETLSPSLPRSLCLSDGRTAELYIRPCQPQTALSSAPCTAAIPASSPKMSLTATTSCRGVERVVGGLGRGGGILSL